MRVPTTIDKNCLSAYNSSKYPWTGQTSQGSTIKAWDWSIPKSLQEQCVECIAKNWIEWPILDEIVLQEDRLLLLDILAETVPLELAVSHINDEVYWEKCYLNRWPNKLPKDTAKSRSSKTTGAQTGNKLEANAWKKYYCEMHLRDYLESLKPENYNPVEIKQLCGLCGPYVDALEIHETICSEASNGKIPLHALLTGLEHLKMLSLRFKQTYAKDEFSWNTVTTSYQDMSLLAKGLQNIRLQELRLTDSDIDCDKAIIILKALCKHDLAVLDLSHCKIGDRGAVAIARFTTLCPVRELYLVNNRIGKYTIRPLLMGHPNLLIANLARNSGTKGVKSLAYAVAQEGCELHHLDLHLNHVSDQAGNILLASLVKYNQSLKSILLSSCSLTNHFQIARALKHRNCIERLDVSNNALGEDTGLELLRALKSNSTMRKLDVRMCKISSSTEAGIQHEVHKNRIGWSKDCASESVAWDDILKAEIENALITTQGFND
uniref:Uncharacterized protein n=1 Tax=Dendroctonus ponderosae TaxID=77166 RepID=A0AAR5Q2L6_DENPD